MKHSFTENNTRWGHSTLSHSCFPLAPDMLCQGIAQLERWAEKFEGDYEVHLAGTRIIIATGLSDIRRILNLSSSKFKMGYRSVS